MITYVLTALIVLICMYAGYSYIKKLRKGGDCCGEREAAEKKVKVADRDECLGKYCMWYKCLRLGERGAGERKKRRFLG